MRREGAAGSPPRFRPPRPDHRALAEWRSWARDHLKDPPEGALWERSGHLYLLPDGLPDLGRIATPAPGLYLGQARKGRFVPAAHLAHALPPGAAGPELALGADDPRALAFALGEPVPHPGPGGWYWVTVEGFGLGWGKAKGRVLRPAHARL